jgi:hypothetical protein
MNTCLLIRWISKTNLTSSNKSLPNESGNVFVATTDHGNAPAGAWGGPIVEVSWADDSHLLLRYDNRAGLSKREELLVMFTSVTKHLRRDVRPTNRWTRAAGACFAS